MTPRSAPLVLIADNDTGVGSLLSEVLAHSGFEVALVTDGQAALDRCEGGDVALLVCDLDMPRVGGADVVRQLALWPAPPPVMVVSGFLDDATRSELDQLPLVRGLFRKPFDVFAFAGEVAAVIGDPAAPL